MNQWNELDEYPILGKYHVRHYIEQAIGTGYMFGKNFDTLDEAITFCSKQKYSYRLLIHIKGDEWLNVTDASQRYYVPETEKVSE
jgi:hypothetical protein